MSYVTHSTKVRSTVGIIAKTVLAAGATGAVIVAPNSLLAFEQIAKSHRKHSAKSYANYLKRSGYFEAREQQGLVSITLTKRGLRLAQSYLLEDYEVTPQKKWDGRWHLLLFDIPERYSCQRLFLTAKLKDSGLRLLQNSVYACPYPLDELHVLIRHCLPELEKFIVYIDDARLDIAAERRMRELFSIKSAK